MPYALCVKTDGSEDGCVSGDRCMGTYIHGILDNPEFVDFLLEPYSEKAQGERLFTDYRAFREEQYDKLADHVRRNVDMKLIYDILKIDGND